MATEREEPVRIVRDAGDNVKFHGTCQWRSKRGTAMANLIFQDRHGNEIELTLTERRAREMALDILEAVGVRG